MNSFVTPKEYLDAFSRDPRSLAILPLQTVADFRGVTRAAIDAMIRTGKLKDIRIGKTRYVQVASLVALEKAYDAQVAKVRAFLEDCAREKKIVFYEPVMALVGMKTTVPADRTAMGAILGTISEQTWAEHGVLLSIIVHRNTQGKTRPGPGFLNLAEHLGLEWDEEDVDAFLDQQTENVWAFYAFTKKLAG